MMVNTDTASENVSDPVDSGQGRRLAMIRASQGLTQAEFAARLGFHKRSYIAWEQGYREMPGRALSRLRQEFNIDPVWLLDGPDGPPRAYVAVLETEILEKAITLVTKGVRQTDLAPDATEHAALVAETYRLLIETPLEAERLLNMALKIGAKRSK